MAQKLWGGRFREDIDALVNRFNASLRFDHRLYPHDIEGSMAHCRMLAAKDIISDREAALILDALEDIRDRLERNEIPLGDDEDIHGLVERLLVEKIGDVGAKLHTGRSRNDQVALDVRLWVRAAIGRITDLVRRTQAALLTLAEENIDLILPGYTHLQRAQPVLLAHHLLAYYEMLKRDRDRFSDTLRRVNRMPLGSAALAGSTFDLDRDAVARDLGFDGITQNSMDAVSDRDFALEFLFDVSMLMMHLSRLSEELVIWSSSEFGFVTISDAFCTGSSIMPQKKNPDLPELIRGKTGRAYGHLMSLLTTMKGLPLTYNKDMQEDKEALFDASDTAEICLEVMHRLLGEISFDGVRMKAATEKGFLAATDLADYLVRKGLPFRSAHEIVGRMVLSALDEGKELHELSLEQLKSFSEKIDSDVHEWLDPSRCPDRRNIPGGTGPEMVKKSLARAKEEIWS